MRILNLVGFVSNYHYVCFIVVCCFRFRFLISIEMNYCLICGSEVERGGSQLTARGIPALISASLEREDGKWKNTDDIILPQVYHEDCKKTYIRKTSIKAAKRAIEESGPSAKCYCKFFSIIYSWIFRKNCV